jgi:uncharacterized membrane protein
MAQLPAFRRVATGRGWSWIAEAFGLFRRNPLIWIALNLVLLLIALALGQIPVLGSYLIYLLTPLFLAGLMTAARDTERGGEIEIAHLFRGFTENASQLITVGGVYLVGNVIVAGVAIALGGAELQEVMRAASEGGVQVEPRVANKAVLAVLVSAALFVPLAMALWFAPALVMLDRVPALKALLLSTQACVANVLPFLLYGIVMSGLLFAALLPALLGLVLWVPIAMISAYTGYRDVFPPGAAEPAPAELR